MSEITIISGSPAAFAEGLPVPALVADAGERASMRFVEFFTANIRNPNTRRAYGRAVADFCFWCEGHGLALGALQPVHVAAYVEQLGQVRAAPTVKQHLAALRMLFDWLVIGQVMPANPAAAVRGPKHVVETGKTPVLSAAEARAVLDAIDVETEIGLRDRALIALLLYTFARVGAAVAVAAGDVFAQERRLWVRLKEKGGKQHRMPCHHALEAYLRDYMERTGLEHAPRRPLFPSRDRRTRQLGDRALSPREALAMVRRRLKAAGVDAPAGCHSFRATGITVYLENGGLLERAQKMAAHASPRTTKLYDRTADRITLDEVERILV